MYVYEKMSTDVKTLGKSDTVNSALEMMKTYNFHRIPIIEGNKLVGLVTQGVIEAATPSIATSLSIYELNYLLNKTTLGDIMIKDVITIGPKALLEEAAVVMQKNNIGALCVVEDNKLVGIITQKDIFDSFIDLLGYHQSGIRYVIEIDEDKVGVLSDITACFTNANVAIESLSVYHRENHIYIQVQADDKDNVMKNFLADKGYNVVDIIELKH